MKIAFRRDSEIYVMNADGSGQINLTNYPGVDYQPCWSPDGTQIAFTSERTGRGDIYVMNADGTGVTRLTSDSDLDGQPSWSPDGTKIAFMSTRDPNPPNGEIYVMNADGSGQTRLTNNPARDADPSWSPAGTEIAFMSSTYDGKDGNGAIYLMNADGGGLKRLSNSVAGWVGEPSWSPDGTQIAFASDIFIDAINTNGSGQTHLIYNAALPSWGEGFRLIGSTAVGGTVSRVMAIENRGGCRERGHEPGRTRAFPPHL
ncbi:MAG: PD40 domain-containing protein [Candidatus Latescibacteria bacterium]|nr:PD40 domain-containing protein [Candidatus Latescibacterota bacterium]